VGSCQLDGVEDAREVDRDDVVPDLGCDLVPRCNDADARVGHHDVELAESRDALVYRCLEGVAVADVDLRGDDAAVESLDLAHGLGQVLLGRGRVLKVRHGTAEVDRDDVGALLRKS